MSRWEPWSWWPAERPILTETEVGPRGLVRPDSHDNIPDEFSLVGMQEDEFLAAERVRNTNLSWLLPWEATAPKPGEAPGTYYGFMRQMRKEVRHARIMPFLMVLDEMPVGQITVTSLQHGVVSSGMVGYWIAQDSGGRGITTLATAMVLDYCLGEYGLHRIEVNIRPNNEPSHGVVNRLGLRHEGVRERYMHIAGAWEDHDSYAITAEELPVGGLVGKLAEIRRSQGG